MSEPPNQEHYYDIQWEVRDWIRLGSYMGLWSDARRLPDRERRRQLKRLREFAAYTRPSDRCGCDRPGWPGVRNAYWAHWPSCTLYAQLDHSRRDLDIIDPWLLPIDQ